MATVYLNGKFLPLEQACISPLDRGFLFGDGVYEVIPVYRNRLFRIEEHLQRLQNSLDAIRLTNPCSQKQWLEVLTILIEAQPEQDLSIYLQVTRGADNKRDHTIPDKLEPTVFAMAMPLPTAKNIKNIEGIKVTTQPDSRWQHCNVKAITLLANVLLKQAAVDKNFAETILIRDGYALEGSASNLFIVKDGTIITPPKSNQLLPGITRDLVLEITHDAGMATAEQPITEEDLFSADEVWITSSTREISPVIQIDDKLVGDGRIGPVWGKAITLFQEFKQRL